MKSALLIAAMLLLLAGCGGFSSPPAQEEPADTYTRELAESPPEALVKERAAETDRTLIYTAFFKLNSLDTDSVHREVISMAYRYNGFILDATPERTTIRIPSVKLDTIIKEIESLGEVVDKKITGTDVTDKYLDLKIRLESALKARERYLVLLEEARSLEETLRMEKELNRINKAIDVLKGKINQMEHVIKYATITVETTPQLKSGPVAWVFKQMYGGVKWLFVRN